MYLHPQLHLHIYQRSDFLRIFSTDMPSQDDSFFDVNGFLPPDHLRETFLSTGYARNRSRTTGAYLVSQTAAAKIVAEKVNTNFVLLTLSFFIFVLS